MGTRTRTLSLLLTMTLLLIGIGYLLGWWLGISTIYTVSIAFVLAVGLNFFTYWKSHELVLKLHDAKIVSESEAPELHNTVERLSMAAGLSKPNVAIIDSDKPNAFATGRNQENAVVAVTKGLLDNMNAEEIEGVISHELAHIKNRDMLVNTMTAMLAGTIAYLSIAGRFSLFMGGGRRNGGILAILGLILLPLAAMMVRLAVSRTREYGADKEGAEISGKPGALASGLEKMKKISEKKQGSKQKNTLQGKRTRRKKSGENPATSHMYIYNPFDSGGVSRLFSTHPPIEERIKRLRDMETASGPSRHN